jgi:hypothetical protein
VEARTTPGVAKSVFVEAKKNGDGCFPWTPAVQLWVYWYFDGLDSTLGSRLVVTFSLLEPRANLFQE